MTFPENIRGSLEMLDPKALLQHAVITYFSLDEYSSRAWQTHCATGKIQRPLQSLLSPQAQFILLYFPLILYMVDICSKKSSNIWTLGKWCIQMPCKVSMCIVVLYFLEYSFTWKEYFQGVFPSLQSAFFSILTTCPDPVICHGTQRTGYSD